MSNKASGISMTLFIVGIVIAILASGLLSTLIATQLAVGPQGLQGPAGFGAPDFDSGWIPISRIGSVEVEHNLGTNDNIIVYVYGRWQDNDNHWHYHQSALGRDRYTEGGQLGMHDIKRLDGVFWDARDYEESVWVHRGSDDNLWEQFRVLIWKIE